MGKEEGWRRIYLPYSSPFRRLLEAVAQMLSISLVADMKHRQAMYVLTDGTPSLVIIKAKRIYMNLISLRSQAFLSGPGENGGEREEGRLS